MLLECHNMCNNSELNKLLTSRALRSIHGVVLSNQENDLKTPQVGFSVQWL